MIELSVVVAAEDAGFPLRKCLAALVGQSGLGQAEILVVTGSRRREAGPLVAEFPPARLLRLEGPLNVPALWTAGILAAQGRIVALTMENCVPAPDWAEKMREAHNQSYAAVGGAMEMNPSGSLMDWAVYFCRYSAYMPPFQPRLLDDLPADNCSYKSAVLGAVRDLMKDGF